MHKALCEPEIGFGISIKMWHAPTVAQDLHRFLQPGKNKTLLDARQRSAQPPARRRRAGEAMSHCRWEVGDGPNHLVYPSWVVPNEQSRWSPLQGAWYMLGGTPQIEEQLDLDPWERTPARRRTPTGRASRRSPRRRSRPPTPSRTAARCA